MIRHIFISTIKDNVDDQQVNQMIQNMKNSLQPLPVVKNIIVERSLGLVGPNNTVTMIIDLDNQNNFNTLLNSPQHHNLSNNADQVFRTDNFVLSKINI